MSATLASSARAGPRPASPPSRGAPATAAGGGALWTIDAAKGVVKGVVRASSGDASGGGGTATGGGASSSPIQQFVEGDWSSEQCFLAIAVNHSANERGSGSAGEQGGGSGGRKKGAPVAAAARTADGRRIVSLGGVAEGTTAGGVSTCCPPRAMAATVILGALRGSDWSCEGRWPWSDGGGALDGGSRRGECRAAFAMTINRAPSLVTWWRSPASPSVSRRQTDVVCRTALDQSLTARFALHDAARSSAAVGSGNRLLHSRHEERETPLSERASQHVAPIFDAVRGALKQFVLEGQIGPTRGEFLSQANMTATTSQEDHLHHQIDHRKQPANRRAPQGFVRTLAGWFTGGSGGDDSPDAREAHDEASNMAPRRSSHRRTTSSSSSSSTSSSSPRSSHATGEPRIMHSTKPGAGGGLQHAQILVRGTSISSTSVSASKASRRDAKGRGPNGSFRRSAGEEQSWLPPQLRGQCHDDDPDEALSDEQLRQLAQIELGDTQRRQRGAMEDDEELGRAECFRDGQREESALFDAFFSRLDTLRHVHHERLEAERIAQAWERFAFRCVEDRRLRILPWDDVSAIGRSHTQMAANFDAAVPSAARGGPVDVHPLRWLLTWNVPRSDGTSDVDGATGDPHGSTTSNERDAQLRAAARWWHDVARSRRAMTVESSPRAVSGGATSSPPDRGAFREAPSGPSLQEDATLQATASHHDSPLGLPPGRLSRVAASVVMPLPPEVVTRIAALQREDLVRFDIVELQLKHRQDLQAAEDGVIQTIDVVEQQVRRLARSGLGASSPWEPFRHPFVLARDGSATSIEALETMAARDRSWTWVRTERLFGAEGFPVTVEQHDDDDVNVTGWVVEATWRYASRWPTQAEEKMDGFWTEERAGPKALACMTVRVRRWRRSYRDGQAERRIVELLAAQKAEMAKWIAKLRTGFAAV